VVYAAIYEGTYKKYGIKKIEVVKQDKKNLFFSPNGDGVNDVVIFSKVSNPVKIYNIYGELVKTLYEDNGQIKWDGTDEQGRPVPGGVYLYLTSDGQKGKIYIGR